MSAALPEYMAMSLKMMASSGVKHSGASVAELGRDKSAVSGRSIRVAVLSTRQSKAIGVMCSICQPCSCATLIAALIVGGFVLGACIFVRPCKCPSAATDVTVPLELALQRASFSQIARGPYGPSRQHDQSLCSGRSVAPGA